MKMGRNKSLVRRANENYECDQLTKTINLIFDCLNENALISV